MASSTSLDKTFPEKRSTMDQITNKSNGELAKHEKPQPTPGNAGVQGAPVASLARKRTHDHVSHEVSLAGGNSNQPRNVMRKMLPNMPPYFPVKCKEYLVSAKDIHSPKIHMGSHPRHNRKGAYPPPMFNKDKSVDLKPQTGQADADKVEEQACPARRYVVPDLNVADPGEKYCVPDLNFPPPEDD